MRGRREVRGRASSRCRVRRLAGRSRRDRACASTVCSFRLVTPPARLVTPRGGGGSVRESAAVGGGQGELPRPLRTCRWLRLCSGLTRSDRDPRSFQVGAWGAVLGEARLDFFNRAAPPAREKSAPGRSMPHWRSIAASTSFAGASSSTAMNLARPSCTCRSPSFASPSSLRTTSGKSSTPFKLTVAAAAVSLRSRSESSASSSEGFDDSEQPPMLDVERLERKYERRVLPASGLASRPDIRSSPFLDLMRVNIRVDWRSDMAQAAGDPPEPEPRLVNTAPGQPKCRMNSYRSDLT